MSTKTAQVVAAAFGYLTESEVALLRLLSLKVCAMRSALQETPVIVNIGAGAGTSSLALRG